MPRAQRGRATRSTRSPATFALDGHLIEAYNHIDDLPQLSSLPKKRPRHATRGAAAAERRADLQAATAIDPQPNGVVTRSARQIPPQPSNSTSPVTAPSPASEPSETEQPPISCRVCLKTNTPTKIICCSICRKGIHTFCLNPPIIHLPNDASWKCIKCRKAHLPLKKEARIILRDALNTYSNLCTDKYVNAVANVICVVSDSESADHKKVLTNSNKPIPQLDPSRTRPNDNTVILRVSTDDSDTDSDVDDPIQQHPIVNRRKPSPTRRVPDPNHSNHQPLQDIKSAPHPQTPLPSGKRPAKEKMQPSSPSSLDIDDERPLSELMSHGAQRRHQHSRAMKSKNTHPVHTSPKMRLKAKQRRIQGEATNGLSSPRSHPRPSRDPRNLPLKRRGRKLASRRTEKGSQDNAKPLEADCDKDTAVEKGDEMKQGGSSAQPRRSKTPPATEPKHKEIKPASNEEKVQESNPPGSHQGNRKGKGTRPDLSDASASNVDEGYPGDTEDDLPLSKRSARYRKMSVPGSNKNNGKDKSTPDQAGEEESRENPPEDHEQVPHEGNPSQCPKKEPLLQETTGTNNPQPAASSSRALSADGCPNPSGSSQLPKTNSIAERKSSDKWPDIKQDPKREALFALARVQQRQRPKPGGSSGGLAASLDGEGSGRFSKLTSRTKNVPESERQRIQVTALAASSMRRNVSNMASRLAGLRPHSPRVSKGSINLLLQQSQPEVRSGVDPQRSYGEIPVHDLTASGYESHRDREHVPPNSSRLHMPERDGGKLSVGMFPPSSTPKRQEGAGSSSVRPYGGPTISGAAEGYSVQQPQKLARSGMLNSIEPEAQSYAKHSRDADLLPHAKRQRNNKSDLRNMLSNENVISPDESRGAQRGDPMARGFAEAGRPNLQESPARDSTVQDHPPRGLPPYSFPHRPHSRFETSDAGRERLSIPQSSMRSNDDRSARPRHLSSDLPYPRLPYGNSVTLAEHGRFLPREEDDRRMNQRPQGSGSTRRGQGSDFRTTSAVYPLSNRAGESFSTGPRWNDNRSLGGAAVRKDYATTSTTNEPWTESRSEHRSALRESSYNVPMDRLIPIDRRTRRPMPYVPTATRKAQFEQGRALAFIDSRPTPPSTDPSDAFPVDDGASRMPSRPYSARHEGPYASPNDYPYPAERRSRATFPSLDSQAPANSFRGDYYPHRRDYGDGSNERRNERSPFLPDSRREAGSGNMFGQSRPSVHRPVHNSSRAPLEPPLGSQKALSMDRMEAPRLGMLVDARARSHPDKDLPRITNTLESDQRLAEKRSRLVAVPGQDDRSYRTSRMGNSTHRSPEFTDRSYGSYSGRNQNEGIRPPSGSVMGGRIPMPLHADPGLYKSRETISGQTGRNFAPTVATTSRSGGLLNRSGNQASRSYGYARSDTEIRRSVVAQRVTSLEGRNEDFGADRVSNIPLVARFDNSLTGYGGGNGAPRLSDRGSRAGEQSMSARNEQREQLPPLRSNPSLRDLIS